MGSLVAEKRPLENGDSSLLVSLPRYKRRRVSATRDFPDGCGPNAVGIIRQKKQEEISEKKEGGVLRNVDSSAENDRDLCQLVTKDSIEEKHVFRKHVDENKMVERVDLKDAAYAIDNKLANEVTSVQPCLLPHYPMPPNFVWKEPKYPPRRKFSAIRDFPNGCGSNVPKLVDIKEKHIGQGETCAKSNEVIDTNSKDIVGGDIKIFFMAEGVDTLEHSSEEQFKCVGNDVRDTSHLSEEQNKELVDYVKDEHTREKSIGVFCRNVSLQKESIPGFESGDKRVIVLGLMSSHHYSLMQGKGVVKRTPNMASGKKPKGKKCTKDTCNRTPNKGKDDTISLAKNIIDDDDSYENNDLDDFQSLPKRDVSDISFPPFGVRSSSERGMRGKVRETLKLFQAVHRKLLRKEETKSKDLENGSNRTEVLAATVLRDSGKFINSKKVIGSVPGVEVGDIFNYRSELAVIGLHAPLHGDIDSIKLDDEPIAISIVASGAYADDMDTSDALIYTGRSGDQKLEKGNLALKNCIDNRTVVRVIRGFKEAKLPETSGGRQNIITTYTYDGLYTVDRCWKDHGSDGKLVYKFELKRVPDQPELACKEMKQSKKFTMRESCCVADISGRKENFPICAVNTIDDEKPPLFTYITSMMYPDWCRPIPSKGCNCKNGCSDSKHCACTLKNGGEIPFNHSGAIVQAKPLVYECGPFCKCPPSCPNRVSQHGIKLPLQIFKTKCMGWGVRCLSAIPSGSFICEYIGELLDDKEAEQRTGSDEYLFDIGRNYNDTTLWEGLTALLPDLTSCDDDDVIDVGFTIDAAKYGNIGRFINHNCTPNLYAQNVLYDHDDKRVPHIMFFATEDIPPLQELTYHYNYTIDQVFDSEGNIKRKSCYCGSAECTGRMY